MIHSPATSGRAQEIHHVLRPLAVTMLAGGGKTEASRHFCQPIICRLIICQLIIRQPLVRLRRGDHVGFIFPLLATDPLLLGLLPLLGFSLPLRVGVLIARHIYLPFSVDPRTAGRFIVLRPPDVARAVLG
jgi:hypothetical protein